MTLTELQAYTATLVAEYRRIDRIINKAKDIDVESAKKLVDKRDIAGLRKLCYPGEVDISALGYQSLRVLAKFRGIPNYSRMDKLELLRRLQDGNDQASVL